MKASLRTAGLVLTFAALAWTQSVTAGTVDLTVDSHVGPWDFSPTLNSSYTYGVNDFIAPVVVSSGFSFSPGGSFTITALGGLTSPYGGVPYADAGGDLGYETDASGGSSGMGFPSLYFNPADYPSYLDELVGTFADAAGDIVGTPFGIGLGRTVTVPSGATQLQLGINDDIFGDNTGSLYVQVTGPSAGGAPDGGCTLVLLGLVCSALGVARRRR
jgi:hypothetical protein